MAKQVLRQVFREVFGREFQPDAAEDRTEMQYAVYLLQDAGISVGDYGFMWCQNGLHSQRLQEDMIGMMET